MNEAKRVVRKSQTKTQGQFWQKVKLTWRKIVAAIKKIAKKLCAGLRKLKLKFLKWLAKWLMPKLEPYRVKPKKMAQVEPKLHIPESTAEFLELMKALPKGVLSDRERKVIATAMNFPEIQVADVMVSKNLITYVNKEEVLGPLTLDRLYRSGFAHFPVIDDHKQILGLLHTEALNSLEMRETKRAEEIMDMRVCYVRDDYNLMQVLAAFYRTNCYFFLVIDPFERIVGLITYQMLVDLLLGGAPQDDFERDMDRTAVAKRKMPNTVITRANSKSGVSSAIDKQKSPSC